MGVREILYTDISRDGMMQSVNLDGHPRAGRESVGWGSSPRAESPAWTTCGRSRRSSRWA